MKRKLRAGMVGGSLDGFIGNVHRMAMRLDGQVELVAGAFSSDPEKSRLTGESLLLDAQRVYADYQTMAAQEAKLPPEKRLDFVSVVTPNRTHVAVATMFLEAGFHVVCDKPLAFDLQEALTLQEVVHRTGRVFALTHNYTGYPMVKEARERVQRGELGEVRKVVVEYPQGWLSLPIDAQGQKQAAWRTDPQQAGAAGCLGDIGTHAQNLVHYITGLQIEELCAEFTTFVPGRRLEDDANLLIRYQGGAKGILYSSQVSAGEENALSVRIYGTRGSLEWKQEQPNELVMKFLDAPRTTLRPGNGYLAASDSRFTRVPAGHPGGFVEAFANVYLEAMRAIKASIEGEVVVNDCDFPTVEDGVRSMFFLEAAVRSANAGGSWIRLRS